MGILPLAGVHAAVAGFIHPTGAPTSAVLRRPTRPMTTHNMQLSVSIFSCSGCIPADQIDVRVDRMHRQA